MEFDITSLFNHFADFVIALGTIFATIYACSKKFRIWVNGKLKDTDAIKDLSKETTTLKQNAKDMADTCEVRSTQLSQVCERLEGLVKKIDKKLEKDKESTVLTLKYEILDICNRADRYKCIIHTDKALLCELYHEYVDVWKENHYVKSEADRIINNCPVTDEYIRNREVE